MIASSIVYPLPPMPIGFWRRKRHPNLPGWNKGFPAILKGFLDRVFIPGKLHSSSQGDSLRSYKGCERLLLSAPMDHSWNQFFARRPSKASGETHGALDARLERSVRLSSHLRHGSFRSRAADRVPEKVQRIVTSWKLILAHTKSHAQFSKSSEGSWLSFLALVEGPSAPNHGRSFPARNMACWKPVRRWADTSLLLGQLTRSRASLQERFESGRERHLHSQFDERPDLRTARDAIDYILKLVFYRIGEKRRAFRHVGLGTPINSRCLVAARSRNTRVAVSTSEEGIHAAARLPRGRPLYCAYELPPGATSLRQTRQ